MVVLVTLALTIVALLVVALVTTSRVGVLVRTLWDRMLALVTLAVGVVVLIVGWSQISQTPYPAEQMPYMISAGIGGLFLLGVSIALWLSADLHDEWRKLDHIEQALRETQPARPSVELAHDRAAQPDGERRPVTDNGAAASADKTERLPPVAADGAR